MTMLDISMATLDIIMTTLHISMATEVRHGNTEGMGDKAGVCAPHEQENSCGDM